LLLKLFLDILCCYIQLNETVPFNINVIEKDLYRRR